MSALLEITGITKRFQKETAVDAISLSIQKGSVFGLLGSNGAGKTTLLKLIAGIYKPDEGTVKLEGKAIYEQPEAKGRIVFLPDSPYFFPNSSLLQMAGFYRTVYPTWSEERFQQLASVFQLDIKRKLHRFSKGMQRQAAFWLALSCMPEVLILDEPIDGLDPVMRRQVKNLLFQESADRQMTVIISSHNLREIEDLCDHVGIMHGGRMLVEKDLDQLKADTHKVQVVYQDTAQEEAAIRGLQILHREERGSVRVYIVRGERSAIEGKLQAFAPYVVDLLPLTLEEIFIYEMEDAGYELQPILF